MPVPVWPLLGLSHDVTLLNPTTVFTPFVVGLVLLSSLCGVGLGVLIARAATAGTKRAATPHARPPTLPKAA